MSAVAPEQTDTTQAVAECNLNQLLGVYDEAIRRYEGQYRNLQCAGASSSGFVSLTDFPGVAPRPCSAVVAAYAQQLQAIREGIYAFQAEQSSLAAMHGDDKEQYVAEWRSYLMSILSDSTELIDVLEDNLSRTVTG